MEYMDVRISSGSTEFQLLLIYRPQRDSKKKLTSPLFFEEFSTLLESVCVASSERLLLAGDFNFHVDVIDDREALRFLNILEVNNLQQHVLEPTHIANHILDLLITRRNGNLIRSPTVFSGLPSDHYSITRPGLSRKRIKCRPLRKINSSEFLQDIQSSLDSVDPISDLDTMVSGYHKNLCETLNKHAPEKERTVVLRPHAPWYTESLRLAKQERRRRERKWIKSGLTVDKELYKEQCGEYKQLLIKSKTEYHSNEVADANQRDLFRVIDKLTSPKASRTLPDHESPKDLANSFATFFNEKIKKLQNKLATSTMSSVSVQESKTYTTTFSEFTEVSEDDVLKAIKSAAITSCPLDPLPVDTFKLCLDELLPLITRIVNLSLTSGKFPAPLKHARIIPLLKKPNLDINNMSNYRPISNLAFLGKVIERSAIQQLQMYLSDNNLYASTQSAYRPFHSVETAVLKVQNDILAALDHRNEALLVLLDFSAAFDLIDHRQLLDRLSSRYGVKAKALEWFESYLDDRTQSVVIRDVSSDPVVLDCGVPQGSVARPLAFTLFSAPLQDIFESHGINSVIYADDTQLFLTFPPKDRLQAIKKIEACIADIRSWCQSNKLVLNDSKTELIYCSSKFVESSWEPSIKIGDATNLPSARAKNLGVIMDSTLSMGDHVNNVCKGALAGIRKIGQIRSYLTEDATTKLVHAFVTSRLDSCNSLLFGLPDHDIRKVQMVQNTAARLVLRVSRREHITPSLEKLHWLPVQQRAIYKILLLAYKALNGMAPEFISNLVHLYAPTRALRSSSQYRLIVPSSATKFYGDRSFAHAAASLWNNLPIYIRQASSVSMFKSQLKTHLFIQRFNPSL